MLESINKQYRYPCSIIGCINISSSKEEKFNFKYICDECAKLALIGFRKCQSYGMNNYICRILDNRKENYIWLLEDISYRLLYSSEQCYTNKLFVYKKNYYSLEELEKIAKILNCNRISVKEDSYQEEFKV